jgi:hypothetical protein
MTQNNSKSETNETDGKTVSQISVSQMSLDIRLDTFDIIYFFLLILFSKISFLFCCNRKLLRFRSGNTSPEFPTLLLRIFL